MNIINQLEELGFENVHIYDDVGNEKYYDALYQGQHVEVRIKDKIISWRRLGHFDEVEWFEVGKVEN